LKLGAPDSADAPDLNCVLDTAAALTTGNSHFLFKIAKTFPGCVSAVYTPDNYGPILLSGVVQRNGAAVTTELSVDFVFNLPYYTTDGQPAQLMVAAGPHVNVNLILGMPFITATRMIIDFGDNVAECHALDCPPFPITSRRARVAVPTVQASQVFGHDSAHYSAFLQDLERLEAIVHGANAASAVPRQSSVRFSGLDDSHDEHPTTSCVGTLPSDSASHELLANNHGVDGIVHDTLDSIDE
jgi:hypothetical protein